MSGEDITPTNMNIDTDHDVSITASVAAAAAAAAAGVDNNDDDDVGNNEDDTTSELENRNGENNRNNENDDDDGDNGSDDAGYDTDQTSTSHFEPSDSKVNSVPFFDVFCKRLEKLWNNKRQKRAFKRWKEDQRLEYIIPRNMIDSLQGQTIYPHLRLLLPDQDSSRQFNLRETKIAQMYCNAVGLAKGTKNYDSLMCFTDPQKVRPDIAGDLSQVVQDVMKLRIPSDLHSKITLGKMNELLDELANLRAAARAGDNARAGGMTGRAHHNHEWRSGRESQAGPRQTKKSDSTLRAEWLSRVMDKWKLSPLEHKWLVRILLRKMDIGLGCATILKWYSPYATELWYVLSLLSLSESVDFLDNDFIDIRPLFFDIESGFVVVIFYQECTQQSEKVMYHFGRPDLCTSTEAVRRTSPTATARATEGEGIGLGTSIATGSIGQYPISHDFSSEFLPKTHDSDTGQSSRIPE